LSQWENVPALFNFRDSATELRARTILRRLPSLQGQPVRIESARGLRDRRGPVHAGAFLRERRIAFDCTPAEFARIFVHEVAHFIWLRLSNPKRRSFEELLRAELARRTPGELGWSAEWRKLALRPSDLSARSRRWREYCCESFCDTAAFLFSGVQRHPEFTLAARPSRLRREWFGRNLGAGPFSI
jgi:hypothetical protein